MPEWARDAALIAAIVALFNAITGRFGSAFTWLTTWREKRRLERETQKTVRALQEALDLKDMELQVKDRIIATMMAELDRRDGKQS